MTEKRGICFLSSNGVGLGHLTRQLAIAQRMSSHWRPLFVTMSYAAGLASKSGYPTLFIPHHYALGTESEDWNPQLELELELLARHVPLTALIYDATAVYGGVIETMARHREIYSVWMRRPMWREMHRGFLALSDRFDAIIEPGELADELDEGPTKEFQHQVHRVPPVLMLAPGERLERAQARRDLALPDDAIVVALQLGSGTNFDMEPVRKAAIATLLRNPEVVVLDLRSPGRSTGGDEIPSSPRHRRIAMFPAFRHSRAFDAAVCAPGYNTFHENILGGIPTLFVPNEADEMDQQLSRARWAEGLGMALLLRCADHLTGIETSIKQLLDRTEQHAMAERCKRIEWTNGASAIVRFIEDHASSAPRRTV
ncbi:MAG: hypothetical protein EOS26_13575 [Mesorhizobium sp.]|nr:MAG: hypothetical protein EOS26_13575 [Mesorhizobium sp.]